MLNDSFIRGWMPTLVLLFILVGCASVPLDNEGDGVRVSPPLDVPVTSRDAYPPLTLISEPVEAYPVRTINESATLLAFDKPVLSVNTVVTGVGPPNLYIYILNITFMGEELGSGVIDEDGVFAITLSELPMGVRIGLSSDINTIGLTEEDIQPGENAISIPQVGYFYDSYVIRE